MALKDLSNLKENNEVYLKAPDGYKFRAVYKRYVPSAMRYEFEVYIGDSDTFRRVPASSKWARRG